MLHSLRHFYASGLIAAGCDVVPVQTHLSGDLTVQPALGNAKVTTTLNNYAHLVADGPATATEVPQAASWPQPRVRLLRTAES